MEAGQERQVEATVHEQAENANGPEDVDATFAEIAAALEREGLDAEWPEDVADKAEPEPDTPPGIPGWRVHGEEWDWSLGSDTEHFVPPEPPKFPRLRAGTLSALALIMTGVILLAIPDLAGLGNPVTTPWALVALTVGATWLILRMRRDSPLSDEDGDNGAQV